MMQLGRMGAVGAYISIEESMKYDLTLFLILLLIPLLDFVIFLHSLPQPTRIPI